MTTEMGFLRKPPKGLMTPASALLRGVGNMVGKERQINAFRLLADVGRHISKTARTSARVCADPSFPPLILGVVAAAFAFAFILNAPREVVIGVLVVGCVTAFLERKQQK
jgi:hypothetical protein